MSFKQAETCSTFWTIKFIAYKQHLDWRTLCSFVQFISIINLFNFFGLSTCFFSKCVCLYHAIIATKPPTMYLFSVLSNIVNVWSVRLLNDNVRFWQCSEFQDSSTSSCTIWRRKGEYFVNAQTPIQVAARSKVWVCGRSFQGLRVRIPPTAWMSVSFECCVLSGRGLCDELRPIHT